MTTHDPVNSPAHYAHPTGVECKQITYDLPTWLGSAIKYIWRRDRKGAPIQDRQKAIECLRALTPARANCLTVANVPTETWDRNRALVEKFSRDSGDLALYEVLNLAQLCLKRGYCQRTYEAYTATIKRLEEELETLTQKEAC